MAEGASARGGAGMNDAGRGFSVVSQAAAGAPSDWTRGRDRRPRFLSASRPAGATAGATLAAAFLVFSMTAGAADTAARTAFFTAAGAAATFATAFGAALGVAFRTAFAAARTGFTIFATAFAAFVRARETAVFAFGAWVPAPLIFFGVTFFGVAFGRGATFAFGLTFPFVPDTFATGRLRLAAPARALAAGFFAADGPDFLGFAALLRAAPPFFEGFLAGAFGMDFIVSRNWD